LDAKGRAAELCLRRLGLAIKTAGLYPLPHPSATQALKALLDAVRKYGEAHGPFATRVGKRALLTDGGVFQGGSHGNVAFYLFTRKITRVEIDPEATEEELTAFLGVINRDRTQLEEAGGARQLLWEAGVRHVRVAELALEHEVEVGVPALEAGATADLTAARRLAPEDREQILEILRSGPKEVGELLSHVYASASGSAAVTVAVPVAEDARVMAVYQAITNLDRLILDEPFEDQQPLYASLAEAQFHVAEPLRQLLGRVLLSRAPQDDTARSLVSHLSGEHLDQLVRDSLSQGEVGDQVSSLLRSLSADPLKTRTTLSILETRLRPTTTEATRHADEAWAQGRAPTTVRDGGIPQEFEIEPNHTAPRHQESERLRQELQAIDEVGVIREVIRTLVDLLHAESEAPELVDIADDLAQHLTWLVEQREFDLLAQVLGRLKGVGSAAGHRNADLAAGVLKKVTEGGLLDHLLAALWAGRDTPAEEGVRACLVALSSEAIGPLVRVLGLEPRAGMRAMLCDLLVLIGRDHVDEIGPFINDSRWYVVRNIVNVLGRLQHPGALVYLERVGRHREYRVRREVVDALAGIGTEDARTLLAAYLDDTDERIQLRAVGSIGTWGGSTAILKLVGLLVRPDPLHRSFALKCETIQTLERLGASEALPALSTLAGGRLVLRPRSRELRRLAREAIAVIQGQTPAPAGPSAATAER
jgi:hypothetical protein